MQDWGLNEWLGVGSAAVAVLSVALNWFVVRRQTELQFEGLKAKADAEMMAWANEAIDAVSDGAGLAKGRGLVYVEAFLRTRLLEVSTRLSALADRGRLFFPNEEHDSHGADKEAAFRGFRPVILDAVIFAHYQVERIEAVADVPDHAAHAYLIKCRRLLVSEVQDAVDPRRRGAMMRRLSGRTASSGTSSFTAASALAEDLRKRYPGSDIGARGPEWIERREAAARVKR